ncbi:MAG: cysteine desulfurase NifS [Chloroflexota bacterium]
MERIYLDYAATTPVHPEVARAMLHVFTETFGNPSALYACGLEAREALEESRRNVARFLGAGEEEIIFTGSGSESDNFALEGVAFANEDRGDHIITSVIEHHAVIETAKFLEKRGFRVTSLPVDDQGLVSPDDVRRAITPKTILISIMHANNEIGTIQPIAEIARIARDAGVYFHTDAVQTFGHLPINVEEMGIDLLSLSAHKLYGPKGVGALYARRGVRLTPFLHGGGQERGRRASTENVPGIVGLSKAVDIAREEMAEEDTRLTALRDRLIEGLLNIEHTRLNGHPRQRLPNNANVTVEFADGEAMCLNLDLEGLCAATGSACSSEDAEPSHVLQAIGLRPEQARASLRFTLGKWTKDSDIDRVLEVLPRVVSRLRSMSMLGQRK